MAYKFIPTRYVDNNSRLLARIYLNRQNSCRVVLRGYYDFDKEKFYISSISKKANTRSVMKFLLKTIVDFIGSIQGTMMISSIKSG